MYDNHISSGRFFHYRDLLSKIYQGEDTETNFDDLQDKIQNDYEAGLLSSSQYDNLFSLIQDV
ncbi:MAG: hypothetical protein IJL12_04200 [Selenomonadaceae bacterium]|nr:hypothetical protein [Selenomonadaceae bacterium]MBQ6131522.1 hypothetical protein [Selenomonadaceae bacterium]